ncbi:MAG: hypothetical protein ABMA00_08570, partial [Gemmatimonas sp.]
MSNPDPSRRRFLAFLAGSPLLAATGFDTDALTPLVDDSPRGAEQMLGLAQQAAQQDTIPAAGIQLAK